MHGAGRASPRRLHRALAVALGMTCLAIGMVPTTAGAAADIPPARDTANPVTLDMRQTTAPATDFEQLEAKARRAGTVPLIVGLQARFTPEADLGGQDAVRAQRTSIAEARANVVHALEGTRHRVVFAYSTVPYLALELSADALAALQRSGTAARLHEDRPMYTTLAETVPLVEANETNGLGRNGLGWAVAVLDTGIQKSHSFLQRDLIFGQPNPPDDGPKVIAEACFSAKTDCPGGTTTSTAPGSGEPCDWSAAQCGHGTHVAGIAAGNSTGGLSGVARRADLISIRIFHKSTTQCPTGSPPPCAQTSESAELAALEHIDKNLSATHKIAAVNMSFGDGTRHQTACDTSPLKASIDNLRAKQIATVIVSGNEGFDGAVTYPGCISSAITVGSTDNRAESPETSTFSNSSGLVDLVAPGENVRSSVPPFENAGSFAEKSGTSMAAPHVAGAWAAMRQISPTASVAQILSAFRDTAKWVPDDTIDLSLPRIRLLAASVRLADTGLRTADTFDGPGYRVSTAGVGLADRKGTLKLVGVPAGAQIDRAYLYWMTLGGADDTVTFGPNIASISGTLVGASRDPDQNINNRSPIRVYRANVSAQLVPGANGQYAISKAGGVGNGVVAKGASLVVVYRDGSTTRRHLRIRHGAQTASAGQALVTGFGPLPAPAAKADAELSVGVGAGDLGTEDALRFNGAPLIGANAFWGSDGASWDDYTRGSFQPTFCCNNTVGLNTVTDSLSWAYTALSYNRL